MIHNLHKVAVTRPGQKEVLPSEASLVVRTPLLGEKSEGRWAAGVGLGALLFLLTLSVVGSAGSTLLAIALLLPAWWFWLALAKSRAGLRIIVANGEIRLIGPRSVAMVRVADIVRIEEGGLLSAARLVTQDGRALAVPANRTWRQAADALAQILPYRCQLKPSWMRSKPGRWSFAGWTILYAVALSGCAWFIGLEFLQGKETPNVLAFPALLACLLLVGAAVVVLFCAGQVLRRSRPVSGGDGLAALTSDELTRAKRAGVEALLPVDLEPGRKYRHLPLAGVDRQERRWQIVGCAAAASILLSAVFLLPAFRATDQSGWSGSLPLLVGACYLTCLTALSAHLAGQLGGTYWVEGDRIWKEEFGRRWSQPLRNKRTVTTLWPSDRILGKTVVYGRGEDEIVVDHRFLIDSARMRYRPESPWEELWDGAASQVEGP